VSVEFHPDQKVHKPPALDRKQFTRRVPRGRKTHISKVPRIESEKLEHLGCPQINFGWPEADRLREVVGENSPPLAIEWDQLSNQAYSGGGTLGPRRS